MSRRYDNSGLPSRKMARKFESEMSFLFLKMKSYIVCSGYQNSFGGNNSSAQYCDTNFFMDLSPPPPPPRRVNCGELREHHNGAIVELNGKVNRTRLGRFIELKDQFGVIQLVAPIEVTNKRKMTQYTLHSSNSTYLSLFYFCSEYQCE